MADYASTILLVHPSSVGPAAFLSRLLGREVDAEAVVVPWTIENKYYTAQTTFQLVEMDHLGSIPAGVDVLIYLFDTKPSILPPGLVKSLVDEPKDVALAVCTAPAASGRDKGADAARTSYSRETHDDEWKDVFEEVGFEVVDEGATPEDDDERPISPLDTVRQTLMTHLWPGMVRKPMQNGRAGQALPAPRDIAAAGDDEAETAPAARASRSAAFPIAFDPSRPGAEAGGSAGAGAGTRPAPDAFPGLAELRAQIEMDEFERFEREGEAGFGGARGRLDVLDEMLGQPGEDEYARLDEWLEEGDKRGEGDEGEFGAYGFEPLGAEGEHAEEQSRRASGESAPEGEEAGASRTASIPPGDVAAPLTFDDDFDDFAAFQSAPAAPAAPLAPLGGLAMDPTPLLLHLQSVRAELAGLDEEERRVKAGREVARVMRDLGFDDLDAADLLGDDGGVMDG